jgi:long-chain-fatty-acyl-CoA reductase
LRVGSGGEADFAAAHRDALGLAGVSRFVELGLSNFFRVGGTHDGIRPLQHLIRFVSAEVPARIYSKGMVLKLDQTNFIENRRFKDLAF